MQRYYVDLRNIKTFFSSIEPDDYWQISFDDVISFNPYEFRTKNSIQPRSTK